MKKAGGKAKVQIPRVLAVPPKIGGFLPFLIPLFVGLGATSVLAGGTAGIVKAINDTKSAKRQLEESQKYNKVMETIGLSTGLYLKPHKTGYDIYLKPYSGRGLNKTCKKKLRCIITFQSTD